MYMRYKFMKRRDIKLTPPAYIHYMEKGWLNPNPHKHNIQCIDGDIKLPLHMCTILSKEVKLFFI